MADLSARAGDAPQSLDLDERCYALDKSRHSACGFPKGHDHPHGWDAAGWLAKVRRQEGEINRLRGLLESERARADEANAVISERARDLASDMERAGGIGA